MTGRPAWHPVGSILLALLFGVVVGVLCAGGITLWQVLT